MTTNLGATPTNRAALVIDDDESFRAALRDLLEQRGLSVRTAGDASAAIRELETERFDVIFTDVRMPGGGFAVLDEVSTKGMHIPVIFITGSSSTEWEARAKAEGAFAYLIKPVGEEQILTVLRRAFERGRSPAELRAMPARNNPESARTSGSR
jgi:DNA-binding NtrC family response regulator